MLEYAKSTSNQGKYQEASLILKRILEIEPENIYALKLKGFSEFMCESYDLSEDANRKILSLENNNAYAMQGLGLALYFKGRSKEEAIE
ncbi:hypothetical protein FACS189465_3350 [Clostridia bacterium]|nr:hypothetical protein FACS189465_3350 [Clostridia bacterium]